jgi:hypothetical protein
VQAVALYSAADFLLLFLFDFFLLFLFGAGSGAVFGGY